MPLPFFFVPLLVKDTLKRDVAFLAVLSCFTIWQSMVDFIQKKCLFCEYILPAFPRVYLNLLPVSGSLLLGWTEHDISEFHD